MSNVKWTEEQEQAIYEKNSNILVAAAAGSGKTAVLVERIINKIVNENIDIDKLLVVTFTNAAASEMRERILDAIYKKIEETEDNQRLEKQILLLNKASICTIDSFCLDVIKNNFFELDISHNFRIADSSEIELIKQETLEELFEQKYEADDEEFTKLIQTYTSYKDDGPLKELILKIYTYIQSSPFPKKWLEEKIEKFNLKDNIERDFSQTIWGKIMLQDLEEELVDGISILEEVKNKLKKDEQLEKYYKTICNDIVIMENLLKSLDLWDKAYMVAQSFKFETWPKSTKITSEEKEKAKVIRDNIKKKITNKINKILVYNSEEANQDIYNMYVILKKLKNLILEFDEQFSNIKREKNILDFSDVEHFALEILLKIDDNGNIITTDVAKKYQEKFEEIAIDEYQDSNLVQEYILTAISRGNNIFMVGDVKQSIYKFRQARPELFLEKYKKYRLKSQKQDTEDLKIQLFKNFRSRSNILDFTNIIFENIMSSLVGDIEYNQTEFLNLGANYKETNEDLKTEIDIINLDEQVLEDTKYEVYEEQDEDDEEIENKTQERIEDVEVEAKFVAKRIKEIIKNNYQVYDIKKEEFRNIQYKDIVILLRSTKDTAEVYEKELVNLEIPVYSDSSSEYLNSMEIQTIMSVLKIIDNPMQDIPLVTVLRSIIGGFTDNELIEIRLADKYDNFYNTMIKSKMSVSKELREKIENFLKQIDIWRKQKEYLSLDELIWQIYVDTGFLNLVGLMPNGALRQANLKMLFERAKQYETASFKGLFNFINFIEKLHLGNNDLSSAKLIGENENVVRIMSIHKSKGLEFPIVFLCNTGKQFNLMDLNKKVLLHQDIGIGTKFVDYDRCIEYDTLSKIAIKSKLFVETLSEEMRILYVALTRAKEKLIITGRSKNYNNEKEIMQELVKQNERKENKINYILVKKYKRYLDWIQLVYLYDERLKDITNLNIYNKNDIIKKSTSQENSKEIDVIKIMQNIEDDDEQYEKIKQILEYKYKNEKATSIPTKTSITQIKEVISKEETDKITVTTELPKFIKGTEQEKITSARRGSLVHLCMQRLDEKKDYKLKDVEELIMDLKQRKIITELEAESMPVNKILEFTKSIIWNELKTAKEVYKEKPFYISVPAKEIYGEDIEENVLVQGVIDLYYVDKNDKLVLLDYKTDYVEKGKENQLIEKYKTQLKWYKRALESALNRKVDKVYIYSVYLQKSCEVENI